MQNLHLPLSVGRRAVAWAALALAFVPAPAASGDREWGAEDPLAATSEGGFVTVAIKKGSTKLVWLDNTGKNPAVEVSTGLRSPSRLVLTPDGSVAAVWGGGSMVVVRRQPKLEVRCRIFGTSWPDDIAISPDGDVVAAVGGPKGDEVYLFDAKSGKKTKSLMQKARISAMAFSPDGKALAVGTEDKGLHLLTLATGKTVWNAAPDDRIEVTNVAFFPGGKLLAVAVGGAKVHVVDGQTGKSLAWYLATHRHSMNNLAVSPDGRMVASCGNDGVLDVWDAVNAKCLATQKVGMAHGHVAFSKDHVFVAEGTALRVFDVPKGKLTDVRKK
jgi:WD40 repeat protein